MTDGRDESDVLQSWLEKLRVTDGAAFDDVRGEIINYASERLEKLTRKMLKGYPRLRRWEQTGDVLQNSVLRLHQALSTIRPDSTRQFFGLAATQIRRELIDMTRHHFGPQGAAARHHTDGGHADADLSGSSTIEREAIDPDESSSPSSFSPSSFLEWTEFHEAVQKLPDDEREVFDLLWYEGLDQKSAATLLNVTDRTIKNRWRSAKLHLRSLWADSDN